MGNLSRHFNRAEFACKCGCGFDTVDARLVEILEAVRTHFACAVTINSGCRCPSYNAKVGGEDKSQHMVGRAADIVVEGIRPALVADFAERLHPGGLGQYNTFTHIDSRTIAPGQPSARWDNR